MKNIHRYMISLPYSVDPKLTHFEVLHNNVSKLPPIFQVMKLEWFEKVPKTHERRSLNTIFELDNSILFNVVTHRRESSEDAGRK
jgi:hypothetical protein